MIWGDCSMIKSANCGPLPWYDFSLRLSGLFGIRYINNKTMRPFIKIFGDYFRFSVSLHGRAPQRKLVRASWPFECGSRCTGLRVHLSRDHIYPRMLYLLLIYCIGLGSSLACFYTILSAQLCVSGHVGWVSSLRQEIMKLENLCVCRGDE